MLACGRCKKPVWKLDRAVYKSGKEKNIHIAVCRDCYDKARTLKVPKLKKPEEE